MNLFLLKFFFLVVFLFIIFKVEGDFLFGFNDKVVEIMIGSDVIVYFGIKFIICCFVEGMGSIVIYWIS